MRARFFVGVLMLCWGAGVLWFGFLFTTHFFWKIIWGPIGSIFLVSTWPRLHGFLRTLPVMAGVAMVVWSFKEVYYLELEMDDISSGAPLARTILWVCMTLAAAIAVVGWRMAREVLAEGAEKERRDEIERRRSGR